MVKLLEGFFVLQCYVVCGGFAGGRKTIVAKATRFWTDRVIFSSSTASTARILSANVSATELEPIVVIFPYCPP